MSNSQKIINFGYAEIEIVIGVTRIVRTGSLEIGLG
jgi:hypothetical protein